MRFKLKLSSKHWTDQICAIIGSGKLQTRTKLASIVFYIPFWIIT